MLSMPVGLAMRSWPARGAVLHQPLLDRVEPVVQLGHRLVEQRGGFGVASRAGSPWPSSRALRPSVRVSRTCLTTLIVSVSLSRTSMQERELGFQLGVGVGQARILDDGGGGPRLHAVGGELERVGARRAPRDRWPVPGIPRRAARWARDSACPTRRCWRRPSPSGGAVRPRGRPFRIEGDRADRARHQARAFLGDRERHRPGGLRPSDRTAPRRPSGGLAPSMFAAAAKAPASDAPRP